MKRIIVGISYRSNFYLRVNKRVFTDFFLFYRSILDWNIVFTFVEMIIKAGLKIKFNYLQWGMLLNPKNCLHFTQPNPIHLVALILIWPNIYNKKIYLFYWKIRRFKKRAYLIQQFPIYPNLTNFQDSPLV